MKKYLLILFVLLSFVGFAFAKDLNTKILFNNENVETAVVSTESAVWYIGDLDYRSDESTGYREAEIILPIAFPMSATASTDGDISFTYATSLDKVNWVQAPPVHSTLPVGESDGIDPEAQDTANAFSEAASFGTYPATDEFGLWAVTNTFQFSHAISPTNYIKYKGFNSEGSEIRFDLVGCGVKAD